MNLKIFLLFLYVKLNKSFNIQKSLCINYYNNKYNSIIKLYKINNRNYIPFDDNIIYKNNTFNTKLLEKKYKNIINDELTFSKNKWSSINEIIQLDEII